jgi:hypothetical protein
MWWVLATQAASVELTAFVSSGESAMSRRWTKSDRTCRRVSAALLRSSPLALLTVQVLLLPLNIEAVLNRANCLFGCVVFLQECRG